LLARLRCRLTALICHGRRRWWAEPFSGL